MAKLATVLMLILAGLMALLFFVGPATPEPVAGIAFIALLGFLAFSYSRRDRNPPPRPAHVEQFGRDLNMAAIPFAIVFIIVILVLMSGGKPW